MLEGYTALSFAAAKTERLRFRLLVGGVTYRHPGLLAKTITTLDVLSGGRAELGSGRRLVRAGTPRARRPLSAAARALRAPRGDPADLLPDVERRQRPLRGHPLPAGRDALLTAAVAHRDRGSSSAEEGSARRSGSWPCTPTPATSSGTSRQWRTRSRCCAGTATTWAVIRQIEVTALIGVADDAGPDDILREAEALLGVGVDSIVIRAAGPEPSRWLEETWGPVVPRLAALG